jgi:hypothetical protein
VVKDVEKRAYTLIAQMVEPEACPVPTSFRADPVDPHFWDYSNDGGMTWTRQPDTVTSWTPVFVADGAAASGYKETVNGGLSYGPIPLLTAADPNAVVTDPASLLRNLITADSGIEGLAIQALANLGVVLIKNNGVAAWFAKIPGLGLANEAVMQIAGGSGYDYPMLETPDT